MKKYKAAVIGAGSIGALKPFELDNPNTQPALTHAHAYYDNPSIELMGIADANHEKMKEASARWQSKNLIDNAGFYLFKEQPDIVSVCVPTRYHRKVISEIIDKIKPKVIVAEKPFCNDLIEAEFIIEKCKENGISLLINYNRRFVPEFKRLAVGLRSGVWGEIYSATFHYTRGLKHEMCHGIDLCRMLFGEFNDGKILNAWHFFEDRDQKDPTFNAWLSFAGCPAVFFSACDGAKYKTFQLEIMTELGKIVLSEHGTFVDVYATGKETTYGNFDILSKDLTSRTQTQLSSSLKYMVREVVDHLNEKEQLDINVPFSCNGDEALAVHKITDYLLKGVK